MSNIYLYKKQCNDEMYTNYTTVSEKKWKKSKKIEIQERIVIGLCLLNCYLFKYSTKDIE